MTDLQPDPTEPDMTTGDIRPLVASPPSKLPVFVFAAVAVIGAIALFLTLDSHRRTLTAPATRPSAQDLVGASNAVPELDIPPDLIDQPRVPTFVVPQVATTQVPAPIVTPREAPSPVRQLQPPLPAYNPPPPSFSTNAPQSQTVSTAPGVVFDAGTTARASGGTTDTSDTAPNGATRARSGHLSNPANTIPQGSIIQVVLETALDSTRPGLARAIVSRDVRGFDGTKVLIPRGSRLLGEYQSDVSAGQNRALIQWTRLIRPDGVTIALQSPAADPLGRAGVRGSVNSHFFERFGGAILQSTLDVGVGLATRHVYGGTVVVGLPGSTTNTPQVTNPTQVRPTIKVKQGASASVFVARDLDFSAAEVGQ